MQNMSVECVMCVRQPLLSVICHASCVMQVMLNVLYMLCRAYCIMHSTSSKPNLHLCINTMRVLIIGELVANLTHNIPIIQFTVVKRASLILEA